MLLLVLFFFMRKWRHQDTQVLARVINSLEVDLAFKSRCFDSQIHVVNHPNALQSVCHKLLWLLLILLIVIIPQPWDHLLQVIGKIKFSSQPKTFSSCSASSLREGEWRKKTVGRMKESAKRKRVCEKDVGGNQTCLGFGFSMLPNCVWFFKIFCPFYS